MISILASVLVTTPILLVIAWQIAKVRARGGRSTPKDVTASIVIVAIVLVAVFASVRHFFI